MPRACSVTRTPSAPLKRPQDTLTASDEGARAYRGTSPAPGPWCGQTSVGSRLSPGVCETPHLDEKRRCEIPCRGFLFLADEVLKTRAVAVGGVPKKYLQEHAGDDLTSEPGEGEAAKEAARSFFG